MDWKLTLVFDLETDGLEATTIHCISIYDSETDEILSYNDTGGTEPVIRGIQRIQDADTIVGHNIIGYDLPTISRLHGWFNYRNAVDTLLLSRLYRTDLLKVDNARKWRYMPLQLYGRHSLKAWGYRLGVYKGCFSETTDWKEWSPEMEAYCEQDVKVTTKLCDHFHDYLTGLKPNIR